MRTSAIGPLMIWGTRLAWLAVALVGGRAVGEALAGRSDAVQLVGTIGAWIGWGAGALSLAVPSVATLTAVRALVPGALAVTIATLAFGADADAGLALGLPAAVAALLVMSAEAGRPYLQGSAYGDELRFGLRPPLGYLAACAITWVAWTASVIAAPLAWAAGAWVIAAAATVVLVAGAATLPRRWHQLSRRWLVSVPAGIVLHDPVVLDDTLMLPRRRIASIAANELGPGTAAGAVDLTGPTPGLAIELRLDAPTVAVLARRPSEPRGRPVSLAALLVSPTRPGAVLREANRRGLPVASLPQF